MTIQSEIKLITLCNQTDAEAIHLMMIAQFGDIGSMTFSQFVSHVRKIHLLLILKYMKN